LSAIILGSTAGILNIPLAIESISFVVVNIAQICLGAAGLASTAIITASRQLEFEKQNAFEHFEHAPVNTPKYIDLFGGSLCFSV
jgi:hypothetical protein